MAASSKHLVALSERPQTRKGSRSKSAVHATVAQQQETKLRIELRPSVSSQWQEHKAPPPHGAHNDKSGCEDETAVIVSTFRRSFLCVMFQPRKPTAIICSYKTVQKRPNVSFCCPLSNSGSCQHHMCKKKKRAAIFPAVTSVRGWKVLEATSNTIEAHSGIFCIVLLKLDNPINISLWSLSYFEMILSSCG